MSARIQIARRRAFHEQDKKCFYCEVEMWELTIESRFDAAERLFGFPLSAKGIKRKIINTRCTAEHLVKKEHKGSDQDENIVAACTYCNSRRGNLTVEEYKTLVRGRNES